MIVYPAVYRTVTVTVTRVGIVYRRALTVTGRVYTGIYSYPVYTGIYRYIPASESGRLRYYDIIVSL